MCTETNLRKSLLESKIPEYMHDGCVLWITHAVRPGSFLSAIIANDLRKAVERADDVNIHLLPYYIRWFYNNAPMGSWGFPAALDNWHVN